MECLRCKLSNELFKTKIHDDTRIRHRLSRIDTRIRVLIAYPYPYPCNYGCTACSGGGLGPPGRWKPQASWWSPANMGGAILGPAVVDVWDGPRSGRTLDPASRTFVFSAGHPWPFDPRPQMVGNTPVLTLSASVAAQRWRDVRLWEAQSGHTACLPAGPSGRPFGRMTETLLPRRSQDFGRWSNVNSGR